jgi:hypothetical protein
MATLVSPNGADAMKSARPAASRANSWNIA